MDSEDNVEFAFCWFDKEQWTLLSEIDPDGVDDSYEKWRNNANKAITELESNKQVVKKVSIKISQLQQWCKDNGLEPNSASRAKYAVELLKSK